MKTLDVTIGAHTYTVQKLDVMRQFHVARRLAPAVWALSRSAGDVLREALPEGTPFSLQSITAGLRSLEDGALMGAVIKAAGPLVDVFAHMSNEDSEFIINECLSVCTRDTGSGHQVAYVPGSGIMFHDMQLPDILKLVLAAIQFNLANFTPAPATPT